MFSDVLLRTRDLLETGNLLNVRCNVEDQGDQGVRLVAQDIRPLEQQVSQKLSVLKIYVAARINIAHVDIKSGRAGHRPGRNDL